VERRLSKAQKDLVASKIMEWGNLVFIGLVIAQLVPVFPETRMNYLLIILGLLTVGGAYFFAWQIMKGGGKK
jgi:hypothetical protein